MIKPYPNQREAIDSLKNGSVLVGGTGSGKSLVGMVYFIEKILGWSIEPEGLPEKTVPLIVITTARKRDELDWQALGAKFRISTNPEVGLKNVEFIVDSWNNIAKYKDRKGAFFIFDEQRSSGFGKWGKTLIKISKNNKWIMLSATPADKWMDLLPVFMANGFYKTKKQFVDEHVVYSPYTKFPSIQRYTNTHKLDRLRNAVYVNMKKNKRSERIVRDIKVSFNKDHLKKLIKTEWHPIKNRPIKNIAEFNQVVRYYVNSDMSRLKALSDILDKSRRVIVFYNFNFELDAIKKHFDGKVKLSEYNGKKHEPVPTESKWLYLVQYLAGNEAWECFTTNHMVFYSLNYSYRIMEQSMGRIDRLTTPFPKLYYYRFVSDSKLDRAILSAIKNKKKFNEAGRKIINQKKIGYNEGRMPPLEKDYQKSLIKNLQTRLVDPIILKTDPTYMRSVPDLLILKGDKWSALEVKRQPDSAVRPNQEYYVNRMNEMSWASFIDPTTSDEKINSLVSYMTEGGDKNDD